MRCEGNCIAGLWTRRRERIGTGKTRLDGSSIMLDGFATSTYDSDQHSARLGALCCDHGVWGWLGSCVGTKSDLLHISMASSINRCWTVRAKFPTVLARRPAAILFGADLDTISYLDQPSLRCITNRRTSFLRLSMPVPLLQSFWATLQQSAVSAADAILTQANIQAPATTARAPASAASAPTAPVSSASGELTRLLPEDTADNPGALTCAVSASVRSPRLWASSSTTKKCLDEVFLRS